MRTNKQLKEITRIWAASLINSTIGCGADSQLLSSEELEYIDVCMGDVADKIHLNNNFGTLDEIIKHTDKAIELKKAEKFNHKKYEETAAKEEYRLSLKNNSK